jgi:hypothetical protein
MAGALLRDQRGVGGYEVKRFARHRLFMRQKVVGAGRGE